MEQFFAVDTSSDAMERLRDAILDLHWEHYNFLEGVRDAQEEEKHERVQLLQQSHAAELERLREQHANAQRQLEQDIARRQEAYRQKYREEHAEQLVQIVKRHCEEMNENRATADAAFLEEPESDVESADDQHIIRIIGPAMPESCYEYIRTANAIAEDIIASARERRPPVMSRACKICFNDEPQRRAVFTACGHVCCLSCVHKLQNDAIDEQKEITCPFCRATTGYVPLFEETVDDIDASHH